MKTVRFIILTLSFIFFTSNAFSKTVYRYQDLQNNEDTRKKYELKVLELALEKTVAKYGEYELIAAPKMNLARAIITLKSNKLENFIVKMSVTKELLDELSYAEFPVDRGIVGYRVSFVSPKASSKLAKVKNLEELKKFNFVQGFGWLDTKILEYHNLKVKTISRYESIFNLVALNRVDLFPRGVNEVFEEYKANKAIPNLLVDKHILLYYALPRFFFMHKSNEKTIQRIEEGLQSAYFDGSLDKLFKKYYQPSIDFVNLKSRLLINIENPFLKGVDISYEKYIYTP